ncbi:MAG: hypothetical protein ACO1OX_11975 [Novosphingobium sp.]
MKRLIAAAVVGALLAPLPGQAQVCLDRETLVAAKVHEFEAMMMAVKLRCRAIGMDISADYEAMLSTHAPVFAAADRRLRAHFAQGRTYEAYATQLGNRYGGGATDPANCQRFNTVARNLAAQPAISALGKVVTAMVTQPRLTGSVCPKP